MCVIAASPNIRNRPTLTELRFCEAANPHGGGVAWLEGATVRYSKGLTADEIHGIMLNTQGPVIAHFRWATVGGRATPLCHPFPIIKRVSNRKRGHAKSVLFHNGTWPGWEETAEWLGMAGATHVSDSMVAAMVVARMGTKVLKGMNGKFAVLDFEKGITFYNDGWFKRNGVTYSNLRWLPTPRQTPVEARQFTDYLRKPVLYTEYLKQQNFNLEN